MKKTTIGGFLLGTLILVSVTAMVTRDRHFPTNEELGECIIDAFHGAIEDERFGECAVP